MSIVQSGLSLALSMPFVLAAWIARMRRPPATLGQDDMANAMAETGLADLVGPCPVSASVDLNVILRDAAVAVSPLANSSWVQIQLALGVAMIVPVNGNALRIALCETMRTAIKAAPGGQMLITAAMSDDWVHIRITDDGPGTDQEGRETAMRQTKALIDSQGGCVAIQAQPGRGTAVTIAVRLPNAANQTTTAGQQAGGPMQLPVLADQAA